MALLKRKRSGLSDPMSVVTRFVNACNRHDADSVAACLHPEFDSIQPMYPSRNFRGADQVRRNWQAIFDAEPGFRLTVLRQAGSDDTVWLELHGAGRDAEVAGIFIMGVQGDRIRWARIYSALVEPLPEGMVDATASSPATLRQVPPLEESADGTSAAPVEAPAEAVVDEDLIAPVVDIDGGGRSRHRRSRRRSASTAVVEDGAAASDDAPAAEPAEAEAAAPETVPVADDTVAVEPDGSATVEPEVVAEPLVVPEPVIEPEALIEPETPAVDAEVAAAPPPEVTEAADLLQEREPEVVAPPAPEPVVVAEPVAPAAPAAEADGDDILWADLASEEPAEAEPEPQPTTSIEVPQEQGLFGKRRARKRR